MKLSQIFLSAGALFSVSTAHFILNIPTSLGFDDDNEGVAPCGGFNIRNRNTVTNWKVKGDTIAVLTTHEESTWEYRVALLSNLHHWVHLTPTLNQTGEGDFCEPTIPGIGGSWLNKPAVLQVIQHGDDGALYQVSPRPAPASRGRAQLTVRVLPVRSHQVRVGRPRLGPRGLHQHHRDGRRLGPQLPLLSTGRKTPGVVLESAGGLFDRGRLDPPTASSSPPISAIM